MKRSPIIVAMLLGAWPLHPGALAGPQEAPQAAPQAEVPTFNVGTAAVTLDVVVRDKKGNAVRDLKASDFEVFEDGVKQRIESFKVYGLPIDEGVAKADTPAAAPVTPSVPPRLRWPRRRHKSSPRSSPSSSTGCPRALVIWLVRPPSPTWRGGTWR
jgi:hypothetical protein